MTNALNITFDTSDVSRLAIRLESVVAIPDDVARKVVNEVARRTHDKAIPRMIDGIALNEAFTRARMSVQFAKNTGVIEAVVRSPKGRSDHVALSHYRPVQETQPTKTRRVTGDPARGIARGQKAAGVSVEVTRGSRKKLSASGVFIAPNRRDSEGNPLVFQRLGGATRSGKNRLRRLLGPSVYQLFRVAATDLLPEVSADLDTTISQSLLGEFNRVLK